MTDPAVDMPEPFAAWWDDDRGLWGTPPEALDREKGAFVTRRNAWMLVLAGMDGALDRVPVDRVLEKLSLAQSIEGPARGNFRWSFDDAEVTDKNAVFFTGLGLAALRLEFADDLDAGATRRIDSMLQEGQRYLLAALEPLDEQKLRYPNARLGEIVLSYLIAQIQQVGLDPAIARLKTALRYYRDSPWGWGEHLSDLYTKVIQSELTMLLLYGQSLPQAVADLAAELLEQLMDLDESFAGGPRVPTIRCYRMDSSPLAAVSGEPRHHFLTWWQLMRDWPDHYRDIPESSLVVAGLGHRAGLHHHLKPTPPGPFPRSLDISCYGKTSAMATVDRDWRLGAMSRYPLDIDLNRTTAGLAWQSMPVAFFHRRGDWAYLQWEAEEDGVRRALPAYARHLKPSCVLSDRQPTAAVGLTRSIRIEPNENLTAGFLVFRALPCVARGWTLLIDRWRHLIPEKVTITPRWDGPWCCVTLALEARYFNLAVAPLIDQTRVETSQQNDHWSMDVVYDRPNAGPGACLWSASVSREPASPPSLDVSNYDPASDAADSLAPMVFDQGRSCGLIPMR